jgi:hypothetical protein
MKQVLKMEGSMTEFSSEDVEHPGFITGYFLTT